MKTFEIFLIGNPTTRLCSLTPGMKNLFKGNHLEGKSDSVFYGIEMIFTALLLLLTSSLNAQQSLEAKQKLTYHRAISEMPHKNLLLFDNGPGQGIYSFMPDSAGFKVKVNSVGNNFVVYGEGFTTDLYHIKDGSYYRSASLPFKTEAAVFSSSGDQLLLLHSKTRSGMILTSYNVRSGLTISSKKVSSSTNSVSINSSGSFISISAGSIIRLLDPESLESVRVYWEAEKQGLLVFNPAESMQTASVTPNGTIQIRNLAEDMILAEIQAHERPVTNLIYDNRGETLFSLDDAGTLKGWSTADNKLIFQIEEVENFWVSNLTGGLFWDKGSEWESAKLEELKKVDGSGSKTNPSSFLVKREPKTFSFFPQPLITFTPETEMQYGASANLSISPRLHRKYPPHYLPSTIVPSIAYAPVGKQLLTSVQTDIYSRTGWRFNNFISYNHRARGFFFDIGNQARRKDRQSYSMSSFSFTGSILKNLSKKVKIGAGYNIRHDSPPDFENEMMVTETGASGGALVGAGPIIQLDMRNDLVFPSNGSFLDTRFYLYRHGLGSEFQYNEMMIDFRKYFPINLGRISKVMALQGFAHVTYGGEIPFYQLPHLTADRVFRGVWRNLYIDRQIAYFQAEYRSFLFQGDTRYGYVLFAGAGDSAENFLNNYKGFDIKAVYGAGYRQQLVPKLRLDLRVDLAVTSKGDFGIYGGVGVAF